MVEYTSHDLDAVFHALSDATRRSMLQTLAKQERTVSELAEPFEMSLAAASKHVKVLERAGLLERTIEGRTHICRINAHPMRSTLEWVRHYEKFWGDRLDILDSRLLAEDEIAARKSKSKKKRKKRGR